MARKGEARRWLKISLSVLSMRRPGFGGPMNALADWIRLKLRNGGWPDPVQVHLENHKVIIEIDPVASTERHSSRDASAVDPRLEALASADSRKDEFLALLSHELRSPLASIQYAVTVLGRQANPVSESAQQRMRTLIERQLGRMTVLLDELRDVSRITSGQLRLLRERTDLRVILKNAIETVEPSIREQNQQLHTELPDVPVWLQADPGRLEQVFVNLLANASRYTDANGALKVWVHVRKGQGVVRFRDTGIGIAPAVLPRIFDLFKQGHETDPRSRSGLGVGLALVRNLVELHGGSVTAASAGVGLGSEFTVRLPTED